MAKTSKSPSIDARGQSPWADAWARFARNRLAMGSLIFVALMAASGYSAPLVSRYLTHFSFGEQHTRLAFEPPGTADVSQDHPTYDGDKAAFAAVDLNHDGLITCRLDRAPRVVLPGLQWLRRNAPSLYAEARARLARLGARVPIETILRDGIGVLRCPELDELHRLSRFYDFFFDTYDTATGDNAPVAGHIAPDGVVTWKEYPHTDAEVKPAFRDRGMTGKAAFTLLDINHDGKIEPWEVTERTRYMRIDKRDLISRFDSNHDLAISRAEFPGAPALHTFWAGTDGKGRDVMTRLFYGARISISIGLLATLISLVIGVAYGSIAGFYGGRLDNAMMRFVDVLYGLPFMFIVILLIVVVGRSTVNLFIALGAVQWLNMARVVRGQVISLKTREFVEAARAIGVRKMAIIFRHLVRNSIGPVIVYSTLLVPAVILEEAFLSFLGLGVQPPDPSWGNMITEGATKFQDYTWLILWPGIALALTLFAMNFVGDGMRDALDPQLQKS